MVFFLWTLFPIYVGVTIAGLLIGLDVQGRLDLFDILVHIGQGNITHYYLLLSLVGLLKALVLVEAESIDLLIFVIKLVCAPVRLYLFHLRFALSDILDLTVPFWTVLGPAQICQLFV